MQDSTGQYGRRTHDKPGELMINPEWGFAKVGVPF